MPQSTQQRKAFPTTAEPAHFGYHVYSLLAVN
jgi:hypothetical protein